jgi:protein-disulfide isomerase
MMTQEAKALTAIAVGTIILIIGAVFFLSRPEKPVSVDTSRLIKEDSLKSSTDSAKLTIVEWGDYQCPACALAHPGLKKAIEDYPGQINFVFRHFPLAQHKNAEIASQAVEAANLQGKVWEMHNKLYESQPEWETDPNALDIFKKYAADLGMDAEKFASDINTDAVKQKVKNDLTDGLALGVNATPTLYFNNELYKGGVSYENFKSEIEKYLK